MCRPTTIAGWVDPAAGAATSSDGRSSTTTSLNGSRSSRVASATRPVVLYGHSLGGLISAGYLLSDRPEARHRRPHIPGARLPRCPPGSDSWPVRSRRSCRRFRSRTTSTARRCRATRRSRPGPSMTRSCVKVSTARFGAAAFDEQARVRAGAAGGFGIRVLVLHGEDDGLVPAAASESPGSGPARRATDLSGSAPRTAQRAGGPVDRRRDHRLVARSAGRRVPRLGTRRPNRRGVRRPSAEWPAGW